MSYKEPENSVLKEKVRAILEICRIEGIEPRNFSDVRLMFNAGDPENPKEVIYFTKKDLWTIVGRGSRRSNGLRQMLDYIHTENQRYEQDLRRQEARATFKPDTSWMERPTAQLPPVPKPRSWSIKQQQKLNPEQINPKTTKIIMNPHYLQTCVEDDIQTIAAVFADDLNIKVKDIPKSEKRYTWKTRLDLEVGDLVVASTELGPRVVLVTEVHDDPRIEEHDEIDYQWAFQKVDSAANKELRDEDEAFKDRMRNEKRRSHRARVKELFEEGKLLGPSSKKSESDSDSTIEV